MTYHRDKFTHKLTIYTDERNSNNEIISQNILEEVPCFSQLDQRKQDKQNSENITPELKVLVPTSVDVTAIKAGQYATVVDSDGLTRADKELIKSFVVADSLRTKKAAYYVLTLNVSKQVI